MMDPDDLECAVCLGKQTRTRKLGLIIQFNFSFIRDLYKLFRTISLKKKQISQTVTLRL